MAEDTEKIETVGDGVCAKLLLMEKILSDARDYSKAARQKAKQLKLEILKEAVESNHLLLRMGPR